jgi:hypothetical protein
VYIYIYTRTCAYKTVRFYSQEDEVSPSPSPTSFNQNKESDLTAPASLTGKHKAQYFPSKFSPFLLLSLRIPCV